MARGGKRSGAGRPKGARNKATVQAKATLEELARAYTDTALETLAHIASSSESDSARVAAATALLDRGYGKPRQTHDTNITMGAGEAFIEMLRMVANGREKAGAVANRLAGEQGQRPDVRH